MSDENKRDSGRVAVGRQFPTQSVVLPYTQTKGRRTHRDAQRRQGLHQLPNPNRHRRSG
ncbi:DUF1589 domain-containing protein [Ruminococcus sp.]|uniref:DUF1589 domain-containing protein n=1 Tax=Ruminococcus sp. TaxID=41978 RepID=UPI001B1FD671|nr:DUF1589 domain-containing protein [Ruminococcus sp.]